MNVFFLPACEGCTLLVNENGIGSAGNSICDPYSVGASCKNQRGSYGGGYIGI